jgi:phosphoenolpyruvate-protein phosphotransferase
VSATKPGGTKLAGVPASPGVAVGPVWHYRPFHPVVSRQTGAGPQAESALLDQARRKAQADIEALVAEQHDHLSEEATIFEAHAMMLADPDLLDRAGALIAEGSSAEAAWSQAVNETAARLESLPSEYFRARATDVRDVGQRVLRYLLGAPPAEPQPPQPVVVAADDLTPSDTVSFDRRRVLAFCTAKGGPTAHAAILARRLGVPAVVALGPDLLDMTPGTQAVVDGDAGTVTVSPDEALVAEAIERRAHAEQWLAGVAQRAGAPAITTDGVTIEVAANVGSIEDAEEAVRLGADGIGLLRTEFLYLGRATAPTPEEQAATYERILNVMAGKPVVVRTLDVGGDKPLPYLPLEPEPNPFLGVRAIRLAAAYPEILPDQLRAILHAASGRALRVMFPMVATVEEMRSMRRMVEQARDRLNADGVTAPADLQVGVMVEIPSAALLAERFVPHVDFFSIGTNDLAQYTLAADRTNPAVASLSDGLHPAVLRLISMVCGAAAAGGRWVGVCGELAGDEMAVPLLLGLGVTELSVNPVSVGRIKASVRSCTRLEAGRLAMQALSLDSAQAVRELVRGS